MYLLRTYFFFLSFLLSCNLVYAQAANVTTIQLPQGNMQGAIKGDLGTGQEMNDLSWAWNSSVACFVEKQAPKFTGKHVLYAIELPRNTILNIRLVPDDSKANFSLYAYSVGNASNAVVPDLASCVSCESDYKWDRAYRGKTQDHTRSVSLTAINNPYEVVIGVVGPNGADSGGFELQIVQQQR